MPKIHTRAKRKFKLGTHISAYNFFHSTVKKHGPRTFLSEEKANEWAEKQGLKKSDYGLKLVKKGKRFQIIK